MAVPFTQTALVGRVLRSCVLTVFPPSESVLSCFSLHGLQSGESFAYLHGIVSFADIPEAKVCMSM